MQSSHLPQSTRQWYGHIFHLSWPIILSGLSVPLVGLVDTAVIGQLPDPKFLAAVGIGAVIFSSLFWAFGFLRMGTTGFIAQYFGSGHALKLRLTLFRALLLALLLSTLLLLLQHPLRSLMFQLMGAETLVTDQAQLYFDTRIWGAPATLVNYVVLGCLFGLQRMKRALLTQWVLNMTNILLDLLFVLQFDKAVEGVALATVVSEYLAAGLGLWLLRDVLKGERVSRQALFDTVAIRKLFAVNRDLFIRTLCLTGAFFFFTAQGAQFGAVVIAANAILLNLLQIIAYGLDGFAHAAEVLAGNAYGARNVPAFQKTVRISTVWAFITALLFSVVYALFGQHIIQFMTVNTEVVVLAQSYLIWVICAPLLAVWSYQMDGVFIGMTATAIMRDTVLGALVIYVITVLLTVPIWGNHALWVCLLLFLLLRGIFLFYRLPTLLQQFNKPIEE